MITVRQRLLAVLPLVLTVACLGIGLNYFFFRGLPESENEQIFPKLDGEIAAVNTEKGDTFKKGDVLFVLSGPDGGLHQVQKAYREAVAQGVAESELAALLQKQSDLLVRAPADGTTVNVFSAQGDAVSAQTPLAEIGLVKVSN